MNTNQKLKEILSFSVPIIIIIACWEIIVDFGLIQQRLLPSPIMIASKLLELTTPDPIIFHHILASIIRLAVGLFIGTLTGIAVGLFSGGIAIANRLISPVISFLVSIPTLAWIPLLLITFGISEITVVITIALSCFFPMVYSTAEGIRAIDKHIIWASQTMGLNSLRTFFQVRLPCAFTSIIVGLRLGIGYAWRALVGAEMLAAAEWGLGFMIYAARAFYDVKAMFLGLVLIALCGLLMDRIIMDPLERVTIERWGIIEKRS